MTATLTAADWTARINAVRMAEGIDSSKGDEWRTLAGPVDWAYLSTLPAPIVRQPLIVLEPLTRRCSRCKAVKDLLSGFHADAKSPMGRRYNCKACECIRKRLKYALSLGVAV